MILLLEKLLVYPKIKAHMPVNAILPAYSLLAPALLKKIRGRIINPRTYAKIFALFLACLLALGSLAGLAVTADENDYSTAYWLILAKNAWNYFQPGVGVVAETGLAGADIGYPYFTDWDAGFYLQAVMDAEKIGVINRTGAWGADERIDKILIFLENRPLMPDGLPYLWYSAQNYQNLGVESTVASDTGKLLVALSNLKAYNSSLSERINNIIYNRTNFEPRKKSVDVLLGETQSGIRRPNIYDYYVTLGFAAFWPERFASKAKGTLDFIVALNKTEYNGIVLPKAKITSDPLLMCIFEFEQNDERLLDLSRQVYLAHEARYNSTGRYVAFSEGSTGLSEVPCAYEWVVMPDGRMWVIEIISQDDSINQEVTMAPVIFLKPAVGYLAAYNTPFTRDMVDYLVSQLPYPASGYNQGVDENGRILMSNNMGVSNGFIVTAARYALENDVHIPDPSPVPTPTNSPSSNTNSQNPASTSNPSQSTKDNKPSSASAHTPKPSMDDFKINHTYPPPYVPSDDGTKQYSNTPLSTEYFLIAAASMAVIVVLTGIIKKRKAVSSEETLNM